MHDYSIKNPLNNLKQIIYLYAEKQMKEVNFQMIKLIIISSLLCGGAACSMDAESDRNHDHSISLTVEHPRQDQDQDQDQDQGQFKLPKIKFTQSESNPGDAAGGLEKILEFSVDPYAPFVDEVNDFLNQEATKKTLCPNLDPQKIELSMNNLRFFATSPKEVYWFGFIKPASPHPSFKNEEIGKKSVLELTQEFSEKYARFVYFKKNGVDAEPPVFTDEDISNTIKQDLNGNIWSIFRDPLPVKDFSYRFSKQEVTDRLRSYNRWISYTVMNVIPPSTILKSANFQSDDEKKK